MSIVQLAVLPAPALPVFPLRCATLRSSHPPPLALPFGLAIGLGSESRPSCTASVLLRGCPAGIVAIDGAALLSPAVGAYRQAARPARAPAQRWSALDVGLVAACALTAAAFVGLFAAEVYARPHGEMDAWMSWDAKARFFAPAGARWRLPFDDIFGHPDYPLLLPATVAHAWRYAATPSSRCRSPSPGSSMATVALLFGGLSGLRGRTVGLLGALCLLATPGFARRAAWLCADGPLAFYALASVVLFAYWKRVAPRRAVLVWAGLAVGLAAWTKREGLLLLGAIAAVRIWSSTGDERRRRDSGWIALGAAAPLALMVYFRLQSTERDRLSGPSPARCSSV